MNAWSFVAAAYGVTLAATLGLSWWAWLGMRRAERTADTLRPR